LAELSDSQISYLSRVLGIKEENLVLAAGYAFLHKVDLNRDGTNELCVSLLTSATCSNGVGICAFLIMRDWEADPLLKYQGHILRRRAVSGQEWSDLVGTHASPDGTFSSRRYVFDGVSYKLVTSQVIGSWANETCIAGDFTPFCQNVPAAQD